MKEYDTKNEELVLSSSRPSWPTTSHYIQVSKRSLCGLDMTKRPQLGVPILPTSLFETLRIGRTLFDIYVLIYLLTYF